MGDYTDPCGWGIILTHVDGVFAGHDGSPGGSADGRHVIVVQDHPVVGQLVYVWRWNLRRPVEAHVVPALRPRQTSQKFTERADNPAVRAIIGSCLPIRSPAVYLSPSRSN